MELDTAESIVVNADYHSKLLSIIAELEYVPQTTKDQIEYIKDLKHQIESSKKRIAALTEKTKKERKEHESLRDSTAKRWAYFLVGKKEKFAEKASKEEREYVEALESEMTERDNQKTLVRMYDEGNRTLEDLQEKATRYELAQRELQALYGRIFDGPTEAFPDDDKIEYDLNAAIKKHAEAQGRVNAESRSAELLAKAAKAMSLSYQNAREALNYSTWDTWGGGTFSDMMERSALKAAQTYAAQAEMFTDQARRISFEIRAIPKVHIAQGSLFGDVFFDNIFSDLNFHKKIKESVRQVLHASEQLRIERDAAIRRTDAAGAVLMAASDDLEARRRELHAFRKATFESYLAQNPPPPNYDASASEPISAHSFYTAPAFPVPQTETVEEREEGVSTTVNRVGDDIDTPISGSTAPSRVGPSRLRMPEADLSPSSPSWGTKNPFAFALSEETKRLV